MDKAVEKKISKGLGWCAQNPHPRFTQPTYLYHVTLHSRDVPADIR